MEEILGQRNVPPPTTPKARSSPREGDVVYVVGLEGSPLLWASSRKPNDESNKYCSQLDQLKAALNKKHLELVNRKRIIFHQDNARPHVSLMTRQKLYSLAGKFWFICHIHQTLHLQISIYFGLYKILLREKISIPWKTVKGTWNSSFLKKIKCFGKMELWSCLENGRR